jgi:hypothetical protein
MKKLCLLKSNKHSFTLIVFLIVNIIANFFLRDLIFAQQNIQITPEMIAQILNKKRAADAALLIKDIHFKKTSCKKLRLTEGGGLELDDGVNFGAKNTEFKEEADSSTGQPTLTTTGVSFELGFDKNPFIQASKDPIQAKIILNPDKLGETNKENSKVEIEALGVFPKSNEIDKVLSVIKEENVKKATTQVVGFIHQVQNQFKKLDIADFSTPDKTKETATRILKQIDESVEDPKPEVQLNFSYYAKKEDFQKAIEEIILSTKLNERTAKAIDGKIPTAVSEELKREDSRLGTLSASLEERNARYEALTQKEDLTPADEQEIAQESVALAKAQKAFHKEEKAFQEKVKKARVDIVMPELKPIIDSVLKEVSQAFKGKANSIFSIKQYPQLRTDKINGVDTLHTRISTKMFICESSSTFEFPEAKENKNKKEK